MGPQLSADLRHVMVSSGRQCASSGSVGAAQRNLLAQRGYLILQCGQASLEVLCGVGTGVILLSGIRICPHALASVVRGPPWAPAPPCTPPHIDVSFVDDHDPHASRSGPRASTSAAP